MLIALIFSDLRTTQSFNRFKNEISFTQVIHISMVSRVDFPEKIARVFSKGGQIGKIGMLERLRSSEGRMYAGLGVGMRMCREDDGNSLWTAGCELLSKGFAGMTEGLGVSKN